MTATLMRRALAHSFAIAAVCSLAACRPPAVDTEADLLRVEATLSELVAPDETVVALFASPTDCLTCYTPVARWVTWGAEHPSSFLFVLSRTPNDVEQRLLAKLRLSRAPIHMTDVAPGLKTPLIVVFRDRVGVYRETLSPDSRSSPLLDLLGERPIVALQEQLDQLGAVSAVVPGASRLH